MHVGPNEERPPKSLVDSIASAIEVGEVPRTADGKNAFAAALGRLGGLKGGKARAAKLTAEQRREIASNAARLRWAARHKEGN